MSDKERMYSLSVELTKYVPVIRSKADADLADLAYPEWVQELREELTAHQKPLDEFRTLPQAASVGAMLCGIALDEVARQGRSDTLTKYLMTREVERVIEVLKRDIAKHRGKKQELVDALIADPLLFNEKRLVLQKEYGCGESTVKEAIKEARYWIEQVKKTIR